MKESKNFTSDIEEKRDENLLIQRALLLSNDKERKESKPFSVIFEENLTKVRNFLKKLEF